MVNTRYDNANQFDIEDTTLPAAQLIPTTAADTKYNLTSFVGDEGMSIATAIDSIDSTKNKEIPIAKLMVYMKTTGLLWQNSTQIKDAH